MNIPLTKKQKEILEVFNIDHPAAFLFHFPQRYEMYESKPMQEWKQGDRLLITGQLVDPFRHRKFSYRLTVTEFRMTTQRGEVIKISAYNQAFLSDRQFKNGLTVYAHIDQKGRVIADKIKQFDIDAEQIVPVYSSKKNISQYHLRLLMKKILNHVRLFDILDENFQKERNLMKRHDALTEIHFPSDRKLLAQALRSLKYEEFLVYQLAALRHKNKLGIEKKLQWPKEALQLPFTLRLDQKEVLEALLEDGRSKRQMRRLLQGDVGSGKTIVSFLLALSYIHQGYQVAFLVPTEALAFQHLSSFQSLFPHEQIVLVNKDTEEAQMESLEKGTVNFALGTHRLFSEKTAFKRLGLVIIDEQHRFGVKQREALLEKGERPDLLMLSATPIPQTLAQGLFMDLDVSTLSFYRQGRVQTHLIKENSIRSILPEIERVIAKREQVYVVCPAVDKGERKNIRNVVDIERELVKLFGRDKVEALHGQMSSEEKEHILKKFVQGEFNILVSTSLIEVGIDVHNANTMIIYNAEQFGLASLHQMRGRVGRGHQKGQCYLLSDQDREESDRRLEALVKYDDGFKLSQIDLETRGMGDLLGTRQAGLPQFYLVDFTEDLSILKQAQKDAEMIQENREQYAFLLEHVRKIEERKDA